jgi:hypothetical protein
MAQTCHAETGRHGDDVLPLFKLTTTRSVDGSQIVQLRMRDLLTVCGGQLVPRPCLLGRVVVWRYRKHS